MAKKLREIVENDIFQGKSRFYFGGHGYFKVGTKVKTHEVYKGVHHAKITGVTEHKYGGATYHVVAHLPKDHPEAVDPKDGETPQRKKHFSMEDKHLTKFNPEHEWDGK